MPNESESETGVFLKREGPHPLPILCKSALVRRYSCGAVQFEAQHEFATSFLQIDDDGDDANVLGLDGLREQQQRTKTLPLQNTADMQLRIS